MTNMSGENDGVLGFCFFCGGEGGGNSRLPDNDVYVFFAVIIKPSASHTLSANNS